MHSDNWSWFAKFNARQSFLPYGIVGQARVKCSASAVGTGVQGSETDSVCIAENVEQIYFPQPIPTLRETIRMPTQAHL